MNTKKFHLGQEKRYDDGKYSIHSFTSDDGAFNRLRCAQESICVLPFDTDEHGKVRNIYLSKYRDHLSNSIGFTCLNRSFNRDAFDSYYDQVEDQIKSELGIDGIDLNSVYYLGQVSHTLPFSKDYRCYAVDLSEVSQDPSGFAISAKDLDSVARGRSMEKVKFNWIAKGEIQDSLVLSCCLLLLSYLSD
jgi:hypothetical protein